MEMIQKCLTILVFSVLVGCASLLLSTDSVLAQPCQIEVVKNADPADNTPFEFTRITTGDEVDFTLMDPDDQTMMIGVSLGESTITENVPDGWALDSIECVVEPDSENVLSLSTIGSTVNVNCLGFTPSDQARGTCTFNNIIPTRDVPTLSQWGMITAVILLGVISFIAFRRRSTTV